MFGKFWSWFMRPSAKWGVGVVAAAGASAFGLFLLGFGIFSDRTSTTEFCISCHEMERHNFAEYKKTLHYQNRHGARATCSDCHIPREFGPKFVAKFIAAKDVVHHFLGTLDTPEKYEKERLGMAQRVWAKMEATDSRECRNCHAFQGMKLEEQGRKARTKHAEAQKEGKSCIACHKGVVHDLPKDYDPNRTADAK